MHVEVRVNGDPLNLLPTLRQVVHDIDPNIPLEKPLTQRAQFEESYLQPKMFARLGGFFGGLAALLVATGLYGTLSYRTSRRSAEIGTRMALGAQRRPGALDDHAREPAHQLHRHSRGASPCACMRAFSGFDAV